MRSSGTGAIPPGPTFLAGKGSGLPGLDRWAAPPVWPSGRRGAGGVCASLPDSCWGNPLGIGKGARVRRLRVDDECGQRSTLARAEVPKSAESEAGRGWSWQRLADAGLLGGDLTVLGLIFVLNGSTIHP